MALINLSIPTQNFELVHNRIGEILTEELQNQVLSYYRTEFDMKVWKERDIQFNQAELPSINVIMERADYDNMHLGQTDGNTRYFIDAYYKAKSTQDSLGDELASNRLQKLLGAVAYILRDPKYKTLGFARPFIQHTRIESMVFGKPIKQDASHVVLGRLAFIVRVPETNVLVTAPAFAGNDTQVSLQQTDQGYYWTI